MMIPRLASLAVLGILIHPVPIGAACDRFGTQVDCGFGGRQVVLGTQTANDPGRATPSLRPQAFHGTGRLLDDRPAASRFRIELQDVGSDPSRCRRIGNEDYCY